MCIWLISYVFSFVDKERQRLDDVPETRDFDYNDFNRYDDVS